MKGTGSIRFSALLILALLCLLSGSGVSGQKVTVVLSGGAARGGAHIGVLRALEEQHVPVSSIVGTSIGAIVGGLYASGFSPDEIEKLMSSDQFQRWATGVTDDRYAYYYRKEDPNASWITTSFDFTRKITGILPAQLIKTYEIDFQIMQMLAQANALAHSNFDSLMIPFRCVAADVDTTASLVLRSGDLATAVRGSMSLPLVFAPVVIRNKLVYDGGMYNNFPCDVASHEFHPDVIIGSRVAVRFEKPDRDDMVSQLLTMLMERQSDTVNFSRSVMIVPDIPSVSLLDFTRTSELADSGYRATLRKIGEIRKLVHDSLSVDEMKARRAKFNMAKPPLIFDSIHANGFTHAQSGYLVKVLKHGKQVVGIDDLKQGYFRFIDEGFVRSIYPMAVYNRSTGYFDLVLDIQKSNKFGAQFGGNFSLGNTSEAFLELQYKYLWSNALHFYTNGYFGKVYSSGKIGGRIDFNSRFPWFIETDFTYNHFNYFQSASFFFDDKNPSYIIESETFGNIGIGIPASRTGKLTLGGVYAFAKDRYYQDNTFSRTDTTDQTTFRFVAPSLCFDLNSLNRKQFPSAGVRLLLKASYVNGLETMAPGSTAKSPDTIKQYHNWFRLKLLYDNYFESLGPFKFGFYVEGVLSNQPLFSNYTSSLLFAPAFQPVPEAQAYFLPPFRATNYAAAGMKTVVRLYKKLEYRLEGYLFQPYREILEDPVTLAATFGPAFADRAFMASTALVYHSPLGPISFTVNYYDKMPDPFTINFNFGYIIFNRRALP